MRACARSLGLAPRNLRNLKQVPFPEGLRSSLQERKERAEAEIAVEIPRQLRSISPRFTSDFEFALLRFRAGLLRFRAGLLRFRAGLLRFRAGLLRFRAGLLGPRAGLKRQKLFR